MLESCELSCQIMEDYRCLIIYIGMRRVIASSAQILTCIHLSWIKSLQYAMLFRLQNFKHMYFTRYQEKDLWTPTIVTISSGTPRKGLRFATLIYVETTLKKIFLISFNVQHFQNIHYHLGERTKAISVNLSHKQ